MTIAQLHDRAVLRVAGADAHDFLQGLLTQDLALLAPATPLYAGLLSPQGKALFDMMLFADGNDVLVDIAADRAAALTKRLSLYRMRKAVTIEPVELAVFAGWDGDAGRHPADPRLAALGSRWIAAPADLDGSALYATHREAVGVPGSAEIGEDDLLWLETGADLLGGVSFTKGCYVGQENTARMHHRDKVRRRLVPISIDGNAGDGIVRDAGDGIVRDAGDGIVRAASDGIVRDAGGRSTGTMRGNGFAHLRLDATGGPLQIGDSVVTVRRPAWLAAALAAAVAAGPAAA